MVKLSTTAQVVLRVLLRDNELCVVALRNDDHEPFSVRVDREERLWDRRFTVPTPVFRRMCKLGLLEQSLEYTVSPGMVNDEGRRISESLISTHWRLSDVGRDTAWKAGL